MGSLNKVMLIGNLGRDPEAKKLPSGDTVCNTSIAISSKWTDKATNEKKTQTEWVNLDFFGKLADIAVQYLTKGSSVYVEGELKTRKYTDKDGVDKYTTSVKVLNLQMLSSKKDGDLEETSDKMRTSSGQDGTEDLPF